MKSTSELQEQLSTVSQCAEVVETNLRFQQLVSDITVRFVAESRETWGKQIVSVCRDLVEFFEVDRCGVTLVDDQTGAERASYGWPQQEGQLLSDRRPDDQLPWTTSQIRAKHCVRFDSPDELPKEAAVDRNAFAQFGVCSYVAVPILLRNVNGFLSCLTTDRQTTWDDTTIGHLQIVAAMLSIAVSQHWERQAREASESRFQAFMDHTPAAIYVKNDQDQHVFGNRQLLKMFGLTPDSWVGTTSYDLFPDGIADHLRTIDAPIYSGEATEASTQFAEQTSGETRYWQDVKFAFPGPEGKRWLAGVAIDITKQKRAEQELRKTLEQVQQLRTELEAENLELREEISLTCSHEEIIGDSDPIRSILAQVEQVAKTESTVLLVGETGTGKELLARAVHRLSPRKDRKMVTVNCANLPGTLIESELFGCEAGAYTGALTKRIGRFEAADKSTIFLDEIGEMSLELQAKLLRVLQDGQFERLGSNKPIKVDVRVIAATNRVLADAVQKGEFREDLYYRLNVFPISIPPLRQRADDIPAMVWAFVEDFTQRMGKKITSIPKRTMQALQEYPWPGNVRELKNVIERAVILSPDEKLWVELPGIDDGVSAQPMTLEDVERHHILSVLEKTGWRVSGRNGAAEILGMKRQTLESRLAKLGISKPT